jgi:hypothetical protein
VSREYLLVDVVAVVESGRELLATNVKFEILVRRIFPVDTGLAYVDAVILAVSNFSANNLEVIMPSGNSTSIDFKLEIIGTNTTSANTIDGTLNVKLNVIVECTLIPWNDNVRGTSQACDVGCSVEKEKVAVAFIDGLYILTCVNKVAQTPVVQTTPPPAPVTDTTTANWILYSLVIVIGVALMLVACICLMRRRPKG